MERRSPACWVLPAAALACAPAVAWAQDAPQPAAPQRPEIQFNRWQEDWSALADPALRTGPFDAIKYIPLSAADPMTYLSLGGAVRERFETNDAPNFGAGANNRSESYVISRTEVHADLRDGPVQAFVQLQSDFAPGKSVRTPVDSDRLDLEQGFVALVEPLGAGVLKLRVGRQQFAFDLQRFVAARDGPNVRQSFDAAWADYEIGPWRLIGYYTQPVTDRDVHPFDDYSTGHNLFYGLRVERHVLGTNELSAYWSRFTNDAATYRTALGTLSGPEQRDVWDARFAGHAGAVDWDLEGMDQTGQVGNRGIRAWAMGSRTGYTFRPLPWSPRLGLQVDAASGDRGKPGGAYGAFNPLFPNGAYVTLAGYTGYVNFIHVKPSVTIQPIPSLALTAAAAAQWRMTTRDAIYTQPNIPMPHTAGVGGAWTGAYAQLRADWRIDPNLTGAVEAVRFQAGDTIRAAGGRDGDYLGVELKYSL